MGTTDSHSCSFRLDQDYRLVRRFISDFYSAEITVVEHKVTKEQLALRESVLQFNAAAVAQQMENRKALNNRNFIALRRYWLQNDLGICSNLFKLHGRLLERRRSGRLRETDGQRPLLSLTQSNDLPPSRTQKHRYRRRGKSQGIRRRGSH